MLPKSNEISFTIWIQLISFWGNSCVCLSVCKCLFASTCIFVEISVKSMIVSGFFIMSSISCCVFMLICFDVYDIRIKVDMIWYDMIWYDMIWYDMIWYDMIWYDMIWYMIWYDMIWYDMIWYDICILQQIVQELKTLRYSKAKCLEDINQNSQNIVMINNSYNSLVYIYQETFWKACPFLPFFFFFFFLTKNARFGVKYGHI